MTGLKAEIVFSDRNFAFNEDKIKYDDVRSIRYDYRIIKKAGAEYPNFDFYIHLIDGRILKQGISLSRSLLETFTLSIASNNKLIELLKSQYANLCNHTWESRLKNYVSYYERTGLWLFSSILEDKNNISMSVDGDVFYNNILFGNWKNETIEFYFNSDLTLIGFKKGTFFSRRTISTDPRWDSDVRTNIRVKALNFSDVETIRHFMNQEGSSWF